MKRTWLTFILLSLVGIAIGMALARYAPDPFCHCGRQTR